MNFKIQILITVTCLIPSLGMAVDFEDYRQSCIEEIHTGSYKNRSCQYNLDLPSPYLFKCLNTYKQQMETTFQVHLTSLVPSEEQQLEIDACDTFFKSEWSPWREYGDYDVNTEMPEELKSTYKVLKKAYSKE